MIRRILPAFISEFIQDSRAVGITLLICTILSMLIANLSPGESYIHFWHTSIHFPEWLSLPHSFEHWINDFLMAFFFFIAGMEIKYELVSGELSTVKRAVLPAVAALGGMLVPAGIYLLFNANTVYEQGWGIPMATDIAFSLGVASILGSRVPASLKVFLMALAIIDDLGAIIVIAMFYGSALQTGYFIAAVIICILLLVLTYFKKMNALLFVIAGLLLWYCIYNSGIHATVAGVVLAMFIPHEKLKKYIHSFHDPVSFIILPLFALANTAIKIPGDFTGALTTSLSWGIIAGLLIGKPLGITLFSWIAVQLGFGRRPKGASWGQLLGISILAAIGFTMSIFITMLAFNNDAYRDISKLAVLIASVAAILLGIIFLRIVSKPVNEKTGNP